MTARSHRRPLCRIVLHHRRRRNLAVRPLPRLPATASAEAVAKALQAHGVVVVEKLVPDELVSRVEAELKAASGTFHGAVGSFGGHHTSRNAAKPLGESAAAQELAIQPLVLEAIEKTLGPWCKKIALGTCESAAENPPGRLDRKICSLWETDVPTLGIRKA